MGDRLRGSCAAAVAVGGGVTIAFLFLTIAAFLVGGDKDRAPFAAHLMLRLAQLPFELFGTFDVSSEAALLPSGLFWGGIATLLFFCQLAIVQRLRSGRRREG